MGYYDNYLGSKPDSEDSLEHKLGWTKKNHKYISRERKGDGWKYIYEKGKEKIGIGLKDEVEKYRAEEAEANHWKEWDEDVTKNNLDKAKEYNKEAKSYQNLQNKYADVQKALDDEYRFKSRDKEYGKKKMEYYEKSSIANDKKNEAYSEANRHRKLANEVSKLGQNDAMKARQAKAKADIAQAKYEKSLLGSIEKFGKIKLKDLFTVTTETTTSTSINNGPAKVTKKTTKKSLLN